MFAFSISLELQRVSQGILHNHAPYVIIKGFAFWKVLHPHIMVDVVAEIFSQPRVGYLACLVCEIPATRYRVFQQPPLNPLPPLNI